MSEKTKQASAGRATNTLFVSLEKSMMWLRFAGEHRRLLFLLLLFFFLVTNDGGAGRVETSIKYKNKTKGNTERKWKRDGTLKGIYWREISIRRRGRSNTSTGRIRKASTGFCT